MVIIVYMTAYDGYNNINISLNVHPRLREFLEEQTTAARDAATKNRAHQQR
jgi:hypothetical protein